MQVSERTPSKGLHLCSRSPNEPAQAKRQYEGFPAVLRFQKVCALSWKKDSKRVVVVTNSVQSERLKDFQFEHQDRLSHLDRHSERTLHRTLARRLRIWSGTWQRGTRLRITAGQLRSLALFQQFTISAFGRLQDRFVWRVCPYSEEWCQAHSGAQNWFASCFLLHQSPMCGTGSVDLP